LFILTLIILFGLWKFEFTFISDNWPTMTIIFVVGVTVLAILSRLAPGEAGADGDTKQEN
jgi:hypothetical protein